MMENKKYGVAITPDAMELCEAAEAVSYIDTYYGIERAGRVAPLSAIGSRRPRRFTKPPKTALVVSTFAAVPYVHLHLEARRRLYPDLPLLVHDDHSPKAGQLKALCSEYGCDFEQTVTRFPSSKGDLSAFVGALAWAHDRKVDLLVKMSRRFVPMIGWLDALARIAWESDYATYSSWTTSFDFGFRTECIGLGVTDWIERVDEIIGAICDPKEPFVEEFMHGLARRIAARNSQAAIEYDMRVGHRPKQRDGYAIWPFIGTDRCAESCNFLWHDWAGPENYSVLASRWNLPYSTKDFVDPNMGYGSTASSSPPALSQATDRNTFATVERNPRVAVYAVCHNEDLLIPFFVRNYDWVDRIVIYDDASTDRTREILRGFQRVEVRTFDSGGVLDSGLLLNFKNHCWKECRGCGFDWVIVVNIDEFVWAPDLPCRLRAWRAEGYGIIRPRGYAMVSEHSPVAHFPLPQQCRRGTPDPLFDKPCIFDPDGIREMQFTAGCHDCHPVGEWRELRTNDVKLLHYRWLTIDRVLAGVRVRRMHQKRGDKRRDGKVQDRWSEKRWRQEFAMTLQRAAEVV